MYNTNLAKKQFADKILKNGLNFRFSGILKAFLFYPYEKYLINNLI